MLYFAYGSNMDWNQMRERCSSSRFVGIAVLRDHRLAFTRRSANWRCGVADAVPAEGEVVWGVIFEIDDIDLGRLDAAEGYQPGRVRNAYRRAERHVFIDGDGERPVAVGVYFASREENPPLPSSRYKNQTVSGAQYWHLPDTYVQQLKAIAVAD